MWLNFPLFKGEMKTSRRNIQRGRHHISFLSLCLQLLLWCRLSVLCQSEYASASESRKRILLEDFCKRCMVWANGIILLLHLLHVLPGPYVHTFSWNFKWRFVELPYVRMQETEDALPEGTARFGYWAIGRATVLQDALQLSSRLLPTALCLRVLASCLMLRAVLKQPCRGLSPAVWRHYEQIVKQFETWYDVVKVIAMDSVYC